jgi:hypothetical protein
MKRRVVWLLALTGVLWLLRRALNKPEPVHVAPADEPAAEDSAGADPAEELRRKLGEARERTDPEPAGTDGEVDERRKVLHEQARATADEMRRSTPD